jgi:putative endonuclease
MSASPHQPTWYVYIVRCKDQSLYTGVTTDLARRLKEHNSSIGGARYTRSRQPVSITYAESAKDRSAACSREYQLKRLTRAAKEVLISSDQNCLKSLTTDF